MYGASVVFGFIIGLGISVGLAFIPANIAGKKGYSYGGFWAFGFFLFLPALIVALCITDKTVSQAPPNNYNNHGYDYYNTSSNYSNNTSPYGQTSISYCPNCGNPVNYGQAYCTNCGNKLL